MAQIKIYGIAEELRPIREQLSNVIHSCVVDALSMPIEKRFHRFFYLEPRDFVFPADRSARYTIIEIAMFAGRSVDAKKQLIKLLFDRVQAELQIAPADLEVTITETPQSNWGIRGMPGDELMLGYRVGV
jgi:phenylpyruvate tautomerase PptA (4-oxalocrotonate tautomerase family)